MSGPTAAGYVDVVADPRAGRVFVQEGTPDGIDPRAQPRDTPERALLRAVLCDGIRTAQGFRDHNISQARGETVAARAWLSDTVTMTWGSSAYCCAVLAIDHDAMLAAVARDPDIWRRLKTGA